MMVAGATGVVGVVVIVVVEAVMESGVEGVRLAIGIGFLN